MKRVLVTGSSGFVGRVLTDVLLSGGYEVLGVDREDAGSSTTKTFAVDLCDRRAVDDTLAETRPDYVVHLAAQSSAGRSFDEPHLTIENNVLPVLHLLEYMRCHPRWEVRLLAVGSAEVYGPARESDLPLVETHRLTAISPYALSKLLQEQCCAYYAGRYETDVLMTRSFNHTGAGQVETFVLPSFARQVVEIKKGIREATVHVGNIDVRRDFLDVRDVCKAYQLLMEKGAAGGIYNVCSGTAFSLRELLEKLASAAGVEINIEVDKSRVRPVDIQVLYGDNSRLTADTGWKPEIQIEDTLASLVDYWEARV